MLEHFRLACLTFCQAHSQALVLLIVGLTLATMVSFAIQVYRLKQRQLRGPSAGQALTFRGQLTPGLRLSSGAMFLLLSVPFLYEVVLKSPHRFLQQPALYIGLVFPALGAGLMMSGIRALAGGAARARLRLDSPEVRTGEFLSGKICLPVNGRPLQTARVHLVLQKTRVFRRRSGWQWLQENPLWHQYCEATVHCAGAWQTVSFRFRIPAHLPGSGRGPARHEWALVVEGEGLTPLAFALRVRGRPAHSADGKGNPFPAQAASLPTLSDLKNRAPGLLTQLGLSLGMLVFVVLFWFAMDGSAAPWAHLPEALLTLLASGAVFLILFGSSVLVVLARLFRPQISQNRRLALSLRALLVADLLVALFLAALFLWKPFGWPENLFIHQLVHWLGEGILGMFFILALILLVVTFFGLRAGTRHSRTVPFRPGQSH
ncbi:MAG: hypothetical protein D6715_05740 [Calditrichaeota bacterium]|nr:MAG: hypothetical protein D6715_05740 [Calditrichota bacterium]